MSSLINCPNCNESIEIKDPDKAKMAHCKSCNATIDLLTGQSTNQNKYSSWPMAAKSRIILGAEGSINGVNYQVVGRIRYRDTRTYEWWDEWLLLSSNGQYMWLQEDDWDFTLMHKYTPKEPFDPTTLTDVMPIDGMRLPVEDNSLATILFFEGELTWKAEIGETMNYADAWKGEDTLYSCEWTDREIMYFIGKDIPADKIYQGFNLGKPPAEAYEEDDDEDEKVGGYAGEGGGFAGWTDRLIKGPAFAYCLIAGIICIIAAIVVNAMGMTVPSTKGNIISKEQNNYIWGPYKFTAKDSVYRVDATMNLPVNESCYCEFEILDDDKETLLGWDQDYWHETGVDSDGRWEESDTRKTAFFVLKEAGSYYIQVTPEREVPGFESMMKISVKEKVAHNWPLWRMAIFSLIFPGFVLVMWMLSHGESSDD